MLDNAGLIVSLSSVIINIIVLIIMGTRALSKLEISLREAITKARAEIDERVERSLREFGETASAIRQKVNEVELWARDNFVRRDGFYKVRDDLTNEVRTLGEKMEARLLRMEEKIDRKN